MNKYTVLVESNLGEYITEYPTTKLKFAEEIAAAAKNKYPDALVYITFYRESDGQTCYYNPDRNFSITGKAW